jgi:hypothetical protein
VLLSLPLSQVLSLFLEVWGAGEEVASRWYAAGCRTLEDVRRRGDLTGMQQVGGRSKVARRHQIKSEGIQ